MLNRKLEAATLTIIIGFFLVPFITEGWRSDYFMIGFIFTSYIAPVLLIVGIPVSVVISNRVRSVVTNGAMHAVAGVVTAALYGFVLGFGLFATEILIIGFIYSVLFWGVDQILMKTRFYKSENGVAV